MPTPADSCTLLVAPLFHVAGLGRLIGQFVAGASVVVQPGFNVKAVLQSLQDDGVCEVLLVPSMIQMLLDHRGLVDGAFTTGHDGADHHLAVSLMGGVTRNIFGRHAATAGISIRAGHGQAEG